MAIFIGKPPDRVLTEEALDPDDNFLIAICESGSAKSARNPRLGEAGRNGGKDGEMRGIRQNRKPHIGSSSKTPSLRDGASRFV